MSTNPKSSQSLDPEHPPEWRDDEFQIASAADEKSDESFFSHIKVFVYHLFGMEYNVRTDRRTDSSFGLADDEDLQQFAIGDGESRVSRKNRKVEFDNDLEHDFASERIRPTGRLGAASVDEQDDLRVAETSKYSHFEPEEDLQTPQLVVDTPESSADDFRIATDRAKLDFAEQIVEEPARFKRTEAEVDPEPDDMQVATAKRMASTPIFSDAVTSDTGAYHSGDEEMLQAASVETRRHFGEQIHDQLGDLVDRLDITNQAMEFGDIDQPLSNNDDSGIAEERSDASDQIRQKNLMALIVRGFIRLFRWLIGIPWRIVSQTGGIQEQSRLKLEPLIAGIPAIIMTMMAYKSVVFLNTSDLLRERNYYLRKSNNMLASSQWEGAHLAMRRACLAANTPANLWQYAQLMLQAPDTGTRLKGRRLVLKLAAHDGDNLPDAHIFLAKELINRKDLQIEQVPEFIELVQNHLRSALSVAPDRLDAVEMLLDLLMTLRDDKEVQRLLVPRLERWPVGHYYLAKLAFNKGDRVNQQISATFAANYYESIPKLLEQSLKDRERYLMCLALAGQWGKAQPILDEWYKRLDDASAIKDWKNRFLAIRTIEKIEYPVKDSTPLISECLIELAKDPKNSDLWNVVSQYADRQPAYGDSVYRSARKIIGANLAALDSEGFMIWGNIARKRRINNDARYFLEQSIKLKPDNVIAANNLANILYKEEPKDYQRALVLIEMVLRFEPNNPIYLETRGQIFALLGQDDRAIDDLTRSLSSFPNVPEIHETLSRLLRRKGSIELALRHESRLTELRRNVPNQNQSGQLVPKPR